MTDLVRKDPFAKLFTMPRVLDEFDDLTTQRGLKIRETDKDILVEAVVAGVAADNIEVHIEDGVLTIKAETKQEEEKKDEYRSSSYSYYYTAALSGGQWDKADAEIDNGIIHITIPKTEAVRPQKISVKQKSK